jgi:hypothetical protein
LLHAIMNRFPVVGDWFRHLSVPPGFAAFFQRRGRLSVADALAKAGRQD